MLKFILFAAFAVIIYFSITKFIIPTIKSFFTNKTPKGYVDIKGTRGIDVTDRDVELAMKKLADAKKERETVEKALNEKIDQAQKLKNTLNN
jgi:hypothetical protein